MDKKLINLQEEYPLVSIITICYNSEKTIEKTINSILSQKYRPLEYIIIDGKSTDSTLKIIKTYSEIFKKAGINYTFLSEKDKGIYDAMNKGIKLTKGVLIGIINSDDWYENNTIDIAISAYRLNPYNVLYGMLRMFKNEKVYHVKQHTHHFLDKYMPQHPTWFVPKTIYNKHGTFNSIYKIGGDYEFANRLKNNGVNFTRIEKVMANFKMGGASEKHSEIGFFEWIKIKQMYGYLTTSQVKYIFFRYKLNKFIDYILWLPIKLVSLYRSF